MRKTEGIAEKQIREVGLRHTAARAAVLQELISADAPLSHAELTGRLKSSGIDQATIFRNLNDLADAGLLFKIALGDQVWRFEYSDPANPKRKAHSHFLCTQCGTVACLEEVNLTSATMQRTKKLGHIDEIFLKGKCVTCHIQD
ncbi:Fur family transcriptional regulator [Thalassoglobus sp.]|uniref:Fur family transcriptional regulator n=1 Tax=Thalassoglobus sp. TaxID=2795869 RepID=UPI003AA92F69